MPRPHRCCRALPRHVVVACVALLAGCETTPPIGATATAQVISAPRDRGDLGGGSRDLHAALLAGVTRASAEQGRLVRGECGEPDPGHAQGIRWHTVTTVLPQGLPARPGMFVEVGELRPAPGGSTPRHGRFEGIAPAPDAPSTIASRFTDRLQTVCRPAGLATGSIRIRLLGPVGPSELDFAAAQLRRHQQLADDELRSGRVVLVSCQLKVVDGSDWYRPSWLARVPPGLELRPGQVVRLRPGATEDSRDVEPLAAVIGLQPDVAAPPGNAVVRCR